MNAKEKEEKFDIWFEKQFQLMGSHNPSMKFVIKEISKVAYFAGVKESQK